MSADVMIVDGFLQMVKGLWRMLLGILLMIWGGCCWAYDHAGQIGTAAFAAVGAGTFVGIMVLLAWIIC